jgi:hypothetical protein
MLTLLLHRRCLLCGLLWFCAEFFWNAPSVSAQDEGYEEIPLCECQHEREPQGTLFRWACAPDVEGGPDLNEPLVTDRPDFTEASVTVGKGVAQLEMGYTYTYDQADVDQTVSHSYPESLLRVGVLDDWLEFRIAWNYGSEILNGFENAGAEDLYLGFKIGLTPYDGFLPEMAIMPQMTVPTGSDPFTADRVLPGLNWLYGWELNDWIETGGSTQFNSEIDGETENVYTQWASSWTVGYSLTQRWSAYTEWFGFFPHGADSERAQNYFDGGFTFLISDDIQWDIRGGVGLNESADDYFVGSGLSIRFR